MTHLSIIIAWALWRRILGGWLGLPRLLIVIQGGVMAAMSFGMPVDELGIALAVVTLAFWTPGHNFMSDRALLMRYGPVGTAWMVTRRWWPANWTLGTFIDGWTAAAELIAGAMFGAFIALIVWGFS